MTDTWSSPTRTIPDSDPNPDTAVVPDRDAEREAKVSRMTYKEFRLIKPDMNSVELTAALIVCYNDNEVPINSKGLGHTESEESELQTPWQIASPTHIAMDSQILVNIIKTETQWKLSETQLIFTWPFKGIITHEVAIREAFRKRNAECESDKAEMDQKGLGSASPDGVHESGTHPLASTSSPSELFFQ